MPFKRKSTGNGGRFQKRRKTTADNRMFRSPRVVRSNAALPSFAAGQRQAITLPMTIRIQKNAGVGGVANQIIRMNSLFDPDFSGTGLQPTGFDQWAAFYTTYTIFAMDYHIIAQATSSSSATGPGIITVGSSNSSTVATVTADAISRADKVVGYSATGGGPASITIKGSYYLPKLFGARYKVGETTFSSGVGNNPAQLAFLIIQVLGANDADDPAPVDLTIKLLYKGYMSQPVRLGQS